MTTIPPERVKELREFFREESQWGVQGLRKKQRDGYFDDLLAILDDYSALRAENERLRTDCAVATKMLDLAEGIIEKQGAELTKQRPLIEAAMADDSEPSFIEVQLRAHMNTAKLERLLRAALKLREEKGK